MNSLKTRLQTDGITCYVAEHDDDYGSSLSEKLEMAIDKSDVVIVILTSNSILSSSVGSEIGYAKRAGKRIIPLIESNISTPVFLQGKEEVRFNHNTVDETCKKISKFINTKLSHKNNSKISDNSTEETVVIESGDYQLYCYELDEGQTLVGQINSDIPVNVFIVNNRNLGLFDEGDEFVSEYSTERVKKCKISFEAPRSGEWNVLVQNEEDDQEEYPDAEVEVFLDAK